MWQSLQSRLSSRWSFGVVIWEVFALGARPYPMMHLPEMFNIFMSNLESGKRMSKPRNAPDCMWVYSQCRYVHYFTNICFSFGKFVNLLFFVSVLFTLSKILKEYLVYLYILRYTYIYLYLLVYLVYLH